MYFFVYSDKIAPISSQEEMFFKDIIIFINHYLEIKFIEIFDSLFLKHNNTSMRNRIFY